MKPPRFRRVVAAFDFSESSAATIARLRTAALATSPALHMVHVVAVPTLTPLPVARQLARAKLDALVKQVQRQFRRARVTSEISSGRPADEIVRIARERKAELIVAGRRGAGGFPRLMLGSTAERMVRLAPVPVLLVSGESTTWKRVIMPVDVTEDVSPLVDATVRLLPPATAIDLLHVYWVYGAGYLALGGASKSRIAAHRRSLRQQAEEAAGPIAAALRRAGLRPAAKLIEGDPRRVVERVLRAFDPGLVVIGNHAKNAVSRALLGSVAAQVLRSSARDIFLVPIN